MAVTTLRTFVVGAAAAVTAFAVAWLVVAPPAGTSSISSPPLVSASHWTDVSAAPGAGQSGLNAVSCSTSYRCIAVGSKEQSTGGQILAEQWNGSVWFPAGNLSVPAGASDNLNSVSCVGTSFCMAVGGDAQSAISFVWNESGFDNFGFFQASVPVPPGATFSYLSSVSCSATTRCQALGTAFTASGAMVFGDQWNGTLWSPIAAPSPPAVGSPPVIEANGLDCTSAALCVAVGTTNNDGNGLPFAELWNGISWSLIDNGISTGLTDGSRLYAVSCAGGTQCRAVGVSAGNPSQGLVEDWNGSTWSIESGTPRASAFSETLTGIDCFGVTSCTAVGYADQSSGSTPASVVLTYDGTSWSLVPNTPNEGDTQPMAVSCLSDWACMAVGTSKAGSPSANTFAMSAPIARAGYRFVASDGGVFAYGAGAPFLGSAGGTALNAPVVGMGVMPAGDGYYLVASDGGIFSYGSAAFYGSTGGTPLNKPVVGMAVTPDGGGYWLVASDGGIFSYGDAQFYGSMGGQQLNQPIVGMAATPDGLGYYLVASDGGIFSFGDAEFFGSTGGEALNTPIVGISVPTSGGYYLVASDGGIFSFPTVNGPLFYGSTGGTTLNEPIVGMTSVQGGYYLVASDGGVFAFPPGSAGPPFYGSTGGTPLNKPIVGVAS